MKKIATAETLNFPPKADQPLAETGRCKGGKTRLAVVSLAEINTNNGERRSKNYE